jgi:hypothetical protein
MFIDNANELDKWRSSGAQCFRQWCVRPISGFAPLEREEIFGGRSFYKHLAPNGAKATLFSCTSKLNPPMRNDKWKMFCFRRTGHKAMDRQECLSY